VGDILCSSESDYLQHYNYQRSMRILKRSPLKDSITDHRVFFVLAMNHEADTKVDMSSTIHAGAIRWPVHGCM
jgi:hypothetical protein